MSAVAVTVKCRFAESTAREIITRLFAETKGSIYGSHSGTSVRNLVSRYARECPSFDIAVHVASASRKVSEAAAELNCPELRDLAGFMQTVAMSNLARFEKEKRLLDPQDTLWDWSDRATPRRHSRSL